MIRRHLTPYGAEMNEKHFYRAQPFKCVLRIEILGVSGSVSSSDQDFERFLGDNYGPYCITRNERTPVNAEIEVKFAAVGSADQRKWIDKAMEQNPVRIGTDIWRGSDSVLYIYGPYCVEARKTGDSIVVNSLFQMTKRFRIMRRSGTGEVLEHYHEIMGLCVHFPIFCLLQQKGYSVLHASMAKRGGDGVLFMGLNGAGKTSAALSLTPNMTIAADNFVLYDGRKAFGYPELIRVPPSTAESLGIEGARTLVFGKKQMKGAGEVDRGVVPRFCVIANIGRENKWERISSDDAIRYIETADRFTHETHLYSYLAFLDWDGEVKRYPECDYYIVTMCGQEAARRMIREKVGGILGI